MISNGSKNEAPVQAGQNHIHEPQTPRHRSRGTITPCPEPIYLGAQAASAEIPSPTRFLSFKFDLSRYVPQFLSAERLASLSIPDQRKIKNDLIFHLIESGKIDIEELLKINDQPTILRLQNRMIFNCLRHEILTIEEIIQINTPRSKVLTSIQVQHLINCNHLSVEAAVRLNHTFMFLNQYSQLQKAVTEGYITPHGAIDLYENFKPLLDKFDTLQVSICPRLLDLIYSKIKANELSMNDILAINDHFTRALCDPKIQILLFENRILTLQDIVLNNRKAVVLSSVSVLNLIKRSILTPEAALSLDHTFEFLLLHPGLLNAMSHGDITPREAIFINQNYQSLLLKLKEKFDHWDVGRVLVTLKECFIYQTAATFLPQLLNEYSLRDLRKVDFYQLDRVIKALNLKSDTSIQEFKCRANKHSNTFSHDAPACFFSSQVIKGNHTVINNMVYQQFGVLYNRLALDNRRFLPPPPRLNKTRKSDLMALKTPK